MKNTLLRHLKSVAFISIGMALAGGPALARQAASKWVPTRESITVSAKPTKNYRIVLSASHLGEAFMVSASMQVPYSDLNLARDPDAAELDRRVHVAARMVCRELDIKYPPVQYPIVDGFDCVHDAAIDGMSRADEIIASARR